MIWEPSSEHETLALDFTHEATGQHFAESIQETTVFADLAAGRWFVDSFGGTQTTDDPPVYGDSMARYVLDLPPGAVVDLTCDWNGCSGEHLTDRHDSEG